MKKVYIPFMLIIPLIFSACSVKELEPVNISTKNLKRVDFKKDVKPILDRRCVVCHSCYNSPCQAKFSSFEGLSRGGSKITVYDATRLKAINPTRLFIDAKSTKEWREKGFYSLIDNKNDSMMIHLLNQKNKNPDIIGSYSPESDELVCPKDKRELSKFLSNNPNKGMPYGFPVISKDEYYTLASWLMTGAKGSDKAKKISKKLSQEIKKWEDFLNKNDAKHKVTSRYLYEHLYLAHISFKSSPNEFFELIRSYKKNKADIIPTLRVFDDPKVSKFYYKFKRVNSTIVHKTHMVVKFDDEKFKRINELFIKPKWLEKPHFIDYEPKSSANPFVKFAQIPPISRYKFLLDNSLFIVMTFIKGPVCRGQMALNVIHDHFWVFFKDPKYDLSVQNPNFLLEQADNLEMPINSVNEKLLRTFSDKYRDKYDLYFSAKHKYYDEVYPNGLGLEAIWRGRLSSDTPALSIYRHFDSASVHKGVIGELPRTAWVIDYPQFERIYYTLVAGYDVFGNVSHQTNIRRYMDFLRMEGELNFLAFLPKNLRLKIFKSWYIKDKYVQSIKKNLIKREAKIHFKTKNPKKEFINKIVNQHLLKSTSIKFDEINYDFKATKLPKKFDTKEDIKQGFKALKRSNLKFIKHIQDHQLNNILVKIKLPNNQSLVYSIIVNKWHDNVNSIFGEKKRLNPKKDTLDFIEGSIGSYPNIFVVVNHNDINDFFDMVANFEPNEYYFKKIQKFTISRDDKNFWKVYDWFQDEFYKTKPIESGLYDLNRYYRDVI